LCQIIAIFSVYIKEEKSYLDVWVINIEHHTVIDLWSIIHTMDRTHSGQIIIDPRRDIITIGSIHFP